MNVQEKSISAADRALLEKLLGDDFSADDLELSVQKAKQLLSRFLGSKMMKEADDSLPVSYGSWGDLSLALLGEKPPSAQQKSRVDVPDWSSLFLPQSDKKPTTRAKAKASDEPESWGDLSLRMIKGK